VKILFIANVDSVYTRELAGSFLAEGHEVHGFDPRVGFLDLASVPRGAAQIVSGGKGLFRRVLHKLRGGSKRLSGAQGCYDVVNVHYCAPWYGDWANEIRAIAPVFVCSVWGSDYIKASDEDKERQKPLYDLADAVSFNNEVIKDAFVLDFNARGSNLGHKARLARLPLGVFTTIREAERTFNRQAALRILGLPSGRTIVCCGTNGRLIQQHVDIVSSMNKVGNRLSTLCHLVFPMAYGSTREGVQALKDALACTDLEYTISESFLPDQEVALLRLVSDVLVQVQEHDMFSGAMQESMMAGKVVLTGSWLPYEMLDRAGGYLHRVDSVCEVGERVLQILGDLDAELERASVNRVVVEKISGPKATFPEWVRLYKELQSK